MYDSGLLECVGGLLDMCICVASLQVGGNASILGGSSEDPAASGGAAPPSSEKLEGKDRRCCTQT